MVESLKFPEFKTKRLLLREPSLDDAPRFHELLCIPEVSTYSDIPQNPCEKRSERFVGWMSKLLANGAGCAWVVSKKSNGDIMGAISINELHNKASYGEIGYELFPQYWNKGFMSEALAAVTEFGHTQFSLNRLEAWTIPGNVASEKVLIKNGYQFEGTLRQRISIRGNLRDVNMYSHILPKYE